MAISIVTPTMTSSARAQVAGGEVWEACRGTDRTLSAEAMIAACDAVIQQRQSEIGGRGSSYARQDLANAFSRRGWLRHRAGSLESAIADYGEAIRLQARHAPAYNNRGLAWLELGDARRAMADFTAAIANDSNLASPRMNRGLLWLARNDAERAVTDFDEVIRREPRDARALALRCIANARRGQAEAAIVDCDAAATAAAALDPFPFTARAAARMIGGAGDAPLDSDLEEALRRAPRSALTLWLRAVRRAQRGDAAGAMGDREAARAGVPGVATQAADLFGAALAPSP